MRRVAQLLLWCAQPPAMIVLIAGIAMVAGARWLLHKEGELRVRP